MTRDIFPVRTDVYSTSWNKLNCSQNLSYLVLDTSITALDVAAAESAGGTPGLFSLKHALRAFLIGLVLVLVSRRYKPWLESVHWLLRGPQLLQEKYVTNTPFTVQTPERQYVVVSSSAHIKELGAAREEDLSLVATAEEVFQPAHTMNGVELNRLGLQHRILRALTLKLPTYQQSLTALAQQALQKELNKTGELEGKYTRHGTLRDLANLDLDWQGINLWNLAQHTIALANSSTFYGDKFAQDQSFLEAAIQYPQDVFVAAEAIRCIPSVIAPFVASWVTRKHRASTELMSKLVPMIQKRLEEGDGVDECSPRDYIQYIISLYPDECPDKARKMAQQTLALWFASVHQPAMTICHALTDLCDHPEYIEPLHEEIIANTEPCARVNVNQLHKLDSFLKESARLNASESISLRRKAVHGYHFRDGTCIRRGDWVCVPQRAIMCDPSVYARAESFDGFRFCQTDHSVSESTMNSKFTHLDPSFPFWGLGRQACPGRFYASYVIKIVLVEIIKNYEIRLRNSSEGRTFTWRSSIIPRATLQVEIRHKQGCTDLV